MQLSAKGKYTNLLSGLSSLWASTLGDSSICIAVLDGLVDRSHPCFDGAKLINVETLVSSIPGSGVALQHGTHIASVIFGQHHSSISGIAPRCSGLIIPIFADEVGGSLVPCSQVDLARAITLAVEKGANIINVSGGQMTQSGQADPLLVQAIKLCAENNVLIVAAAGNDGCQCLHIPAALPTVLAVGAMDAKGLPLDFSNWGEAYQNQGILALGENILGAAPGNDAVLMSGTSFATPIVSGIAALLLSLQLQQGKQANPQAIHSAILQSALPCNREIAEDCSRFLAGTLDIAAAQSLIQKGEKVSMNESNPLEISKPEENKVQPDNLTSSSTVEEPKSTASAIISSPLSLVSADSSAVSPSKNSTSVNPSEGCECGSTDPIQFVYALGSLGYDFGTEARRDAFDQNMGDLNPNLPSDLLTYLDNYSYEAQSLIWTLNLDATPIYAIKPTGSFGQEGYGILRNFLNDQINENAEIISLPGVISGSTRLISGQTLPTIIPNIRGLYNWNAEALVGAAIRGNTLDYIPQTQRPSPEILSQGLGDYLEQIYYRFRNLGKLPQERALNFSATNAFSALSVIAEASGRSLQLDDIKVEKSPICRPNSECYDVKISFFDPESIIRSRRFYRFTVDVSDVLPVTIGKFRVWSQR